MKKINDNIWKINADSNVYVFLKEKLVIDTGNIEFRGDLEKSIKKIIDPNKVKKLFSLICIMIISEILICSLKLISMLQRKR